MPIMPRFRRKNPSHFLRKSKPGCSRPFLRQTFHFLTWLDNTAPSRHFEARHVLLNFWTTGSAPAEEQLRTIQQAYKGWKSQGLQLLTINVDDATQNEKVRAHVRDHRYSFPVLRGSDDVAGIYNILYRYLFDRHRDMSLPTSFLIDAKGQIVKLYQGPVKPEQIEEDFRHIPQTAGDRLAKALPFPGVTSSLEFRRNYLNYGSVYFQRGYYDQSEASFRLALGDDPSSAEALYGLGSVYLKQDKNDEARESFERATELQASYPDTLANAWNNLGLLATREGKTAEAIPYFQEALRLNPDHLVALDNLGNAYRQEKDWDQSRANFRASRESQPGRSRGKLQPGHGFRANRRQRSCLPVSAKGVERPPRIPRSTE